MSNKTTIRITDEDVNSKLEAWSAKKKISKSKLINDILKEYCLQEDNLAAIKSINEALVKIQETMNTICEDHKIVILQAYQSTIYANIALKGIINYCQFKNVDYKKIIPQTLTNDFLLREYTLPKSRTYEFVNYLRENNFDIGEKK